MSHSGLDQLEYTVIQAILGDEAMVHFENGVIPNQMLLPFVSTIKNLSERYTAERASKEAEKLKQPHQSDAYALYFTLINFCKIQHLLEQLSEKQDAGSIDVLDYGCGTGTAGLAVASYFKQSVSIMAVDHSKVMLKTARRLAHFFKKNSDSVHWNFSQELDPKSTRRFDIIFLANILNEMTEENASGLVQKLTPRLKPGGVLIILEPALFGPARRLMVLRDEILDRSPRLTPIFPCTTREVCPMLEEFPKECCHGVINWERPRLVQQLDQLTGLNEHRIKYASLILQKNGNLNTGYRLVGNPLKQKFGVELMLCSEEGLNRLALSKKTASKQKREISRLNLLDLINLSPVPDDILKPDPKTKILINQE